MPMNALLKPGYSLGGNLARTLKNEFESNFAEGTHEFWMERALQVSMNGVGWTAPNPAVGCCIVRDGQLIAEGFTQEYRHEHAERMAFKEVDFSKANEKFLKDAVVYVTLEPCAHIGSQPPCVDLLLNAPMETIVIACQDPDTRVNGLGIQKLKDAGKTVIMGVLENEAQAWHFPFLRSKKNQEPVWVGKWAQTKSGHLADADGNSKWITNAKSRAYTHWLRQKYDAIVVGAGTWMDDEPRLDVRDCASPHRRNPVRLIFDPKGRLLSKSGDSFFKKTKSPIKVFVCEEKISEMNPASLPLHERLEIIPIRAKAGDKNLFTAFKTAVNGANYPRPLQSVFVEGGTGLLTGLLRNALLDGVHQFTGTLNFDRVSDEHQILFQPDSQFTLLTEHEFDGDYLHEWIKCS
jgi:diaminohydroxyphosphoribosylaminopyrimidine deaminase/5-amino-6-(5-phosphoribosylamino)uracil reductase